MSDRTAGSIHRSNTYSGLTTVELVTVLLGQYTDPLLTLGLQTVERVTVHVQLGQYPDSLLTCALG